MSTHCPCPTPPGGAVTCEGRQFAYCRIVAGKVRSGCIPIPSAQADRPTQDTVLPLFQEVVASTGFETLLDRSVVISARPDEHGPSQPVIVPAGQDLPEFLYTCMQEGWVVIIASRRSIHFRAFRSVELMIRFPSVWSRADRGPQMVSEPLLER